MSQCKQDDSLYANILLYKIGCSKNSDIWLQISTFLVLRKGSTWHQLLSVHMQLQSCTCLSGYQLLYMKSICHEEYLEALLRVMQRASWVCREITFLQ